MAEKQSVYTDFKDPFHLLNELRNIGLERVYKNAFAYGNREDMNMGYHSQPNPAVGRASSANYSLPVNAPSTEWTQRQGSGTLLPPPTQINYKRSYGSQTLVGGERQRIGTIARPLSDLAGKVSSDIRSVRSRRKAERLAKDEDAYRSTFDPSRNYNLAYMNAYEESKKAQEQAQREKELAPQVSKLGELTNEMENVGAQIEQRKSILAMTKGIEEFRNTQRQAQGRQVQAQNREGFFKASPTIPSSTEKTYPKGHPMGMLTEPNQGSTSAQAANIYNMQPPSPLGSPSASTMSFDVPKSNIPPGETAPYPRFDKSKNTSSLSTAPSRPAGYNPSQTQTPPGPPSMHRMRRR